MSDALLPAVSAASQRIHPQTAVAMRTPLTAARARSDAACAPLFAANQTPSAYRAAFLHLAAMALIAAAAQDGTAP